MWEVLTERKVYENVQNLAQVGFYTHCVVVSYFIMSGSFLLKKTSIDLHFKPFIFPISVSNHFRFNSVLNVHKTLNNCLIYMWY